MFFASGAGSVPTVLSVTVCIYMSKKKNVIPDIMEIVRHIILVSDQTFLSGELEGRKGKFPVYTYCCVDDSYLQKVLEWVQ